MAKCIRCGRGGLLRQMLLLYGNESKICTDCYKALGFHPKDDLSLLYRYEDIKDGREVYEERRFARLQAHYDFNVHLTEEGYEIAEKYQRLWTDREDRYEGMTKREIKENGVPGEKYFKYPPMDVGLDLVPVEVDGRPMIEVYLLTDKKKDPLIGYAPKTKVKKILQLIDEHDIRMRAELSGGEFRELVVFSDGEAVCDGIPTETKIQVRLDWSHEIK